MIAIDLQGHGRTADVDRPLGYDHLTDDVAALIRHLGLSRADVMRSSLGGGLHDGGWDGSGKSAHRLAISPTQTAYC